MDLGVEERSPQRSAGHRIENAGDWSRAAPRTRRGRADTPRRHALRSAHRSRAGAQRVLQRRHLAAEGLDRARRRRGSNRSRRPAGYDRRSFRHASRARRARLRRTGGRARRDPRRAGRRRAGSRPEQTRRSWATAEEERMFSTTRPRESEVKIPCRTRRPPHADAGHWSRGRRRSAVSPIPAADNASSWWNEHGLVRDGRKVPCREPKVGPRVRTTAIGREYRPPLRRS